MGSKSHCNVNVRFSCKLLAFLAAALFCPQKPSFGALPAPDVFAMDSSYTNIHLSLGPSPTYDSYGPLFYERKNEMSSTWAIPPLMSHSWDEVADFDEWDFLYPLVSLDRFGGEYRFHIIQVFAFAGGQTQAGNDVRRFTLFPVYFQQRSPDLERNYTALIPLGGHLKNRLFRDDIKFVLMPIWVRSRKRDVVTDNYIYPFFHLRHGEGLHGWQFWPLYGQEHKTVTYRTNIWDEVNLVPGHEKKFVLWPFYLNATTGIGGTNETRQRAVLPLFSITRSPNRDSSTYIWPFGYTRTVDREKGYTETDVPWPIIVFARGQKTTTRVWPLFSHAHDATKESAFYLWPVYKYNRIHSDPLDRERTRILFFLYSDTIERNTETGHAYRRKDLWPFFTARRDLDGNEHFQVLSILEPLLPNSKSIERNYSHIWSLWRSEKDARSGATDQSLLWDLYHRHRGPDSKKISLLFGLFKYQSTRNGNQWRAFYLPFGDEHETVKHANSAP